MSLPRIYGRAKPQQLDSEVHIHITFILHRAPTQIDQDFHIALQVHQHYGTQQYKT